MMVKIINNDILEEIDHLDDDFDICFTSPPYNLKKNKILVDQKKIIKIKIEKKIMLLLKMININTKTDLVMIIAIT